MRDRFEYASVIQTIAIDIMFIKIFYVHHWKDSRAEKNPTMTNIVLLWLLSKTILNDSYYRWTCASNHFSIVQFVFEERRHISCAVTGPRQYSSDLERLLLHDQQRT